MTYVKIDLMPEGAWVCFSGTISGAGGAWEIYDWVSFKDLRYDEIMDELAKEAVPNWAHEAYSLIYEWKVVDEVPKGAVEELRGRYLRQKRYAEFMLKQLDYA